MIFCDLINKMHSDIIQIAPTCWMSLQLADHSVACVRALFFTFGKHLYFIFSGTKKNL